MTSPGARYSAGTAFLDVIPSFRGVQRAIQREVQQMESALGKQGERSGEEFGKGFEEKATNAVDRALGTTKAKAQQQGSEAGKAYAGAFEQRFRDTVRNLDRQLAGLKDRTIKIGADADTAAARRQIEALDAQMRRLRNAKLGVDLDTGTAVVKLEYMERQLRALRDVTVDVGVRTNLGAALAEIEAFKARVRRDADLEIEVQINAERSLGAFERTVRARIEAALKNFPPIEFDADVTPAQQALMELRAEMQTLGNKRIGIDIDGRDALAEMERIRVALDTIARDADVDVQVRTDAAAAAADLAKVNTLRELVDGKDVDINVDVDTGQAITKLAALRAALLGTGSDGERSANSFRAFNAVILAATAILPAAVPAIAALGAGLALLGPLAVGAAGGLAVLGIGFSGIGDAVKAMGKVQENAAKDAEAASKKMETASRSVADAQRALQRAEEAAAQGGAEAQQRVTDAREDAARASQQAAQEVTAAQRNVAEVAEESSRRVAGAIEAQEDAERDLVRAQADVVRAQQDVTRARQEAAEELEDLRLAVEGGALAERQAVLDLAEAERDLAAARAEGVTGDELAQYILDVDKADLALRRARESNGDLTEETARWARTGIEGSAGVVAAQEGVIRAREGVADAEERVRDAAAGVADAVRQGQEAQEAAAQRLTDAIANQTRVQAEGSRAISDAVAAQRQAQTDAARAVGDAQLNLTQAQADYQRALYETSVLGSESMQALEIAMGKLGPAGQRFAEFWYGLYPRFRELRDLVQAGMFPGLEDAITRILQVQGPALATFMSNMGQTLGNLFREFGEMMTSPQWQGIWATFNEYAPRFMQQFGEMAFAMLTFFGELFVTLAPYAERFGDALIRAIERSADWAASLRDSQGFLDFMQWFFEVGPQVWSDIADIFVGLKDIFMALMPLGMIVLDLLAGFARWLSDLPTGVLEALVTGIIGLVIAFQLASGAVALFVGAFTIISVPLAATVFAIAAVVTGIIILYTQSETARAIIDAAFRAIGDAATWLWNNAIKPAFEFMGQLIRATFEGAVWAWENLLWPAFVAIGEVLTTVWNDVVWPILVSLGRIFLDVLTGMKWAWDNILWPVLTLIGEVIGWLWTNIFSIYFGLIWDFIQVVFAGIKWAWENILWPAFTSIGDVVGFLWDNILRPIFEAIGIAFKFLVDAMKWAWDNILRPVFEVIMAVAEIMRAILVVAVFTPILAAWVLISESMKWAWENILRPAWQQLQSDASWMWNNVLKPVFDAIGWAWDQLAAGMRWVYDNVIKPYIIEPFMGLMETLSEAFDTAVENIKRAWESIQNALARPINFVIHYVLNRGLFGGFNWIIDKLGLPGNWKIDPWAQVGDRSTHFAAGGRVPGWSPNDKADNIPAMLTAGEYVHPVDSVNYYGADVMERLRKKKIPREELQYLATGGFVQARQPQNSVYIQPSGNIILPLNAASGAQIFAVTKAAFPRAKLNSSFRPGDPGYHGRNMAADLGEEGFAGGSGRPYIAAMKRWWYDNFGRTAEEIIYNGLGNDRPNVNNGRDFPYSAATQVQHYNHLHVAESGALAGAVGAPTGGTGVLDTIVNIITDPFGTAWSAAGDALAYLKKTYVEPLVNFSRDFGNNSLTGIIKQMPPKAADWMWEKIKDQVGNFFTNTVVGTATVGDTTQVKGAVSQVFGARGWQHGTAEFTALDRLIQKESSWNPTAQNPVSTASGLFQHINGTWNAYKRPGVTAGRMRDANVMEQAYAGMNYIVDRYGSPSAALAFHNRNNWYSEGGEVTEDGKADAPTLYDTGGWLPPGITTVLNATNRPEPVLTGQMWDELVGSRGGDDGDNSVIGELHLHQVQSDLSEAIGEVNHWARTYRHGGRYTGVGRGN